MAMLQADAVATAARVTATITATTIAAAALGPPPRWPRSKTTQKPKQPKPGLPPARRALQGYTVVNLPPCTLHLKLLQGELRI